MNSKFRYGIGKTYTYDYHAASLTSVVGTSEDKAALNINGQALVTFRDRCNVELSLRKTSLDGFNEQVRSYIFVQLPQRDQQTEQARTNVKDVNSNYYDSGQAIRTA